MSSLRERVEGLVASWRKKADGMDDGTGVTLCAELAQHYRNRADELAAALVAEGQGAPDDGNIWSQVRRLNEIRLRALATPGEAIFNTDDARFLLSLIEVRDRAFKELTRITAERAAAPSLHKEERNMNYLADLRHDLQDEEFALAYLSACAKEGDDTLRIGIRDMRAALHKEGAGGGLSPKTQELIDGIAQAINRVSGENGSNTPDFILAEYLVRCLKAFDIASRTREKWYGQSLSIGAASPAGRAEEKEH